MGIEAQKALFDQAGESSGVGLPKGIYHFKVEGVAEATDAYLRLDTEVVCGEVAGRRGPGVTLWGESDYDEVPHQNFYRTMKQLTGGAFVAIETEMDLSGAWDEEVLEKYGDAFEGMEFSARVTDEKKQGQLTGYQRLRAIGGVANAKCDCESTPAFGR